MVEHVSFDYLLYTVSVFHNVINSLRENKRKERLKGNQSNGPNQYHYWQWKMSIVLILVLIMCGRKVEKLRIGGDVHCFAPTIIHQLFTSLTYASMSE